MHMRVALAFRSPGSHIRWEGRRRAEIRGRFEREGQGNVAGARCKPEPNGTARAACAVTIAVCLAALAITPRLGAPKSASLAPARAGTAREAAPFRVGETLNYRVEWSAFSNAAEVALTIPERRDLYGWQTWHFRAAIHTVGLVRSLFEIDQFDSYTDVATFASRQFEEYLSELGRKQTEVMRFVSSSEAEASRVPPPTVVVLPGTRDPLGALYDLRTIDWDHTPELRAPVYDGKNMYQMVARRESANEPVTTAAGAFIASRISIQVYQYERPVSGIHFEIWLANDATRAPLLMRLDLPLGNLRVELTSAK